MFRVRDLTRSFLAALQIRVKLDQAEAATLKWYAAHLTKLDRAAGDFPAAELRAEHLIGVEFTNSFVRVLKALYKWAADEDVQLVARNPFRKLTPPPCGQRERVLTRPEFVRLYLASSRPFRRFLFVLARTIARPGEIRGLRWGDVQWERRLIVLKKFKGKRRRKDNVKVRTIPLDWPTLRLLRNLFEHAGRPAHDAPVWIGKHGRQWSPNAVRCQMRRVRVRAGLLAGEGEEQIVAYTLRHTGGTNATRAGVRDAELAQVMGHARTATTARYQHLNGQDVVNAIDRVSARPRKQT